MSDDLQPNDKRLIGTGGDSAMGWVGLVSGSVLIGGGLVAASVASTPEPAQTPAARPSASAQACRRLCFPFEPTQRVTDGDTVKGRALLGMGVSRNVKVRLDIDAAGKAASAFTRAWIKAGEVDGFTLCVPAKKQDNKRGTHTLGEICTRGSCLARSLRLAGHAKNTYDSEGKR